MNRSLFRILCTVWAFSAGLALAAQPAWRNLGPGGGGWIQSIAASPHDPEELFVGCDVGGFYRSTDGGRNYQISNTGLEDYFVECIVPHPRDPVIIYLGCSGGVYKSTDRGRSWQWLREGFPPPQRGRWSAPVGALAIDPDQPETLYAGIGRPRMNDYGAGAVYRTIDGGRHWSRVNAAGSLPDDAVVTDLVIDPGRREHLYLACQHGVFQSYDRGTTWKATVAGLPHRHLRRLALCPRAPRVLYLTLHSAPGQKPWQGGVYKSTDAGQHWTPCLEGLKWHVGKPGAAAQLTTNYDRLVVAPDNPEVVYVGATSWTNAGVYKTTNGGRSWIATNTRENTDRGWIDFNGLSVKCLAISALDPQRLYFGTSMHVFRTSDGADHWEQAYTRVLPDGRCQTTGLETTCLGNIIIDPNNARRLLFGYADIGLLVSSDGGETFRRSVAGIKPRTVANSLFDAVFDPDDPQHIWGSFGAWATNAGVVAQSYDGGHTWRDPAGADSGLPEVRHRVLLLDPASPAEARRLMTTADEHGIYASEDGGRTWQARNEGLPAGNVRDLVAHPKEPGHYWCAVADEKRAEASLFVTADSGRVWKRVGAALPTVDVRHLAVAPTDPDRLYLAARQRYLSRRNWPGGIFRSKDGGATWRHVLDDRFAQAVTVDPRNADVVYAGLTDHPYHDRSTGGGVMGSRDGGKTWSSLNGPGLTCTQVVRIVLDPQQPNRVYLCTSGNGAFVAEQLLPDP